MKWNVLILGKTLIKTCFDIKIEDFSSMGNYYGSPKMQLKSILSDQLKEFKKINTINLEKKQPSLLTNYY